MFNQFLSSTYSSILSYRKLFMYNGSGNSCEKNLCNNIFFSARILNAHKINCKLWFDVLITLTHSIGADWYMYFIILWNFFYPSTLKCVYFRLLKSKTWKMFQLYKNIYIRLIYIYIYITYQCDLHNKPEISTQQSWYKI